MSMLGIPKGIMQKLGIVIAPLLFWMSAGWFLYPSFIGRLADDIGESPNMDLVRIIGYIVGTISAIIGVIVLLFSASLEEVDEEAFVRQVTHADFKCPFCVMNIPWESEVCPECGSGLPPVE